MFRCARVCRGIEETVHDGRRLAPELKRSTGELKEAVQTLCAFLNGSGGIVLFGVRQDGTIEGQEVSDRTLREISQAADRFEPPAHVSIHRIKVKTGRDVVNDVVVVAVEGGADMRRYASCKRLDAYLCKRLEISVW